MASKDMHKVRYVDSVCKRKQEQNRNRKMYPGRKPARNGGAIEIYGDGNTHDSE
jgi:hypothetical protein